MIDLLREICAGVLLVVTIALLVSLVRGIAHDIAYHHAIKEAVRQRQSDYANAQLGYRRPLPPSLY